MIGHSEVGNDAEVVAGSDAANRLIEHEVAGVDAQRRAVDTGAYEHVVDAA